MKFFAPPLLLFLLPSLATAADPRKPFPGNFRPTVEGPRCIECVLEMCPRCINTCGWRGDRRRDTRKCADCIREHDCSDCARFCLPGGEIEETSGCCHALAVGGDLDPYGSLKGVYHKSLMTHNNKPYYKARALDMCIFFTDWWKVDQCKYVEPAHKNDKSVGYLSSFIPRKCPGEIGLQWRLYSGGVNGHSGPIQPNATVTCVYD